MFSKLLFSKIRTIPKGVRQIFDAEAYLSSNPDVRALGHDPLRHYLEFGIAEGRLPPPNFTLADIMAQKGGRRIAERIRSETPGAPKPIAHITKLKDALRPIFDADAYLALHPDVARAGVDPVRHYLEHGIIEGRQPPPLFNQEILTRSKAGSADAQTIRAAQLSALPKGLANLALDEDLISDNLGIEHPLPTDLIIAAGIVLYNNHTDEIERLLRSISNSQNIKSVAVRIVVINNGEALSEDMAALLACANVTVLVNRDGNIGSSAGHSRLMQHAFCEMNSTAYFTLNPDGLFHPYAIERMIRMASRHSWRAAIEASQLPNENGKYFDPHTLDTEWAVTACAIFSRKIWEAIGGFDPNIFLYCDDVDYGWRIRRAGFAVKYCPIAYYFHDYAARTATSTFYRQNRLEAGRYLAHKWRNQRFREKCERILIEAEFYRNTREMPEIDHLPTLTAPLNAANFNHEFFFAQPRW